MRLRAPGPAGSSAGKGVWSRGGLQKPAPPPPKQRGDGGRGWKGVWGLGWLVSWSPCVGHEAQNAPGLHRAWAGGKGDRSGFGVVQKNREKPPVPGSPSLPGWRVLLGPRYTAVAGLGCGGAPGAALKPWGWCRSQLSASPDALTVRDEDGLINHRSFLQCPPINLHRRLNTNSLKALGARRNRTVYQRTRCSLALNRVNLSSPLA